MLGVNLGPLLYGDVSEMLNVACFYLWFEFLNVALVIIYPVFKHHGLSTPEKSNAKLENRSSFFGWAA